MVCTNLREWNTIALSPLFRKNGGQTLSQLNKNMTLQIVNMISFSANKRKSHIIIRQLKKQRCFSNKAMTNGLKCTTFQTEFDTYIQAYANLRKVITHAKYRSFQYRLQFRAIVFNDKLFRWKIESSNLCSNCIEEPKRLANHFFIECITAKRKHRNGPNRYVNLCVMKIFA